MTDHASDARAARVRRPTAGSARRGVVATAAVLTVLAVVPEAHAQDTGYQRAEWTDPAPSGDVRGTPLAYLDSARSLTGVAVHDNGIANITAVLVPDPTNLPPEGCGATVDPNPSVEPDGATFHVQARFPCNRIYEIRANVQSNPGSGLGGRVPEPRAMPLLVAVAIPPAPVAVVEAEVDGREVTLSWPGNSEPDLLGYVVERDGEPIGEVAAGDTTRFVDRDPPAAGGPVDYRVIAYRQGPDGEVKQVGSAPTAVTAEVPAEPGAADEGASAEPDPQVGGDEQAPPSGAPPGGGASGGARSQAPARLGTATTLDTGFGETLPFDTSGEAAAPPTGDPAVVATFDDEADGLDEKQRLSFIAGGLAVLMGAAVILHVTRRAAREAY